MKETKLYWYHNTAYSMEAYFVCLDFPNLILAIKWMENLLNLVSPNHNIQLIITQIF